MKSLKVSTFALLIAVMPWPQAVRIDIGTESLGVTYGHTQAWADDDDGGGDDGGGAGGTVGNGPQTGGSGSNQSFWKSKKKQGLVKKTRRAKSSVRKAAVQKPLRLAIASNSEIISRNLTSTQVGEIQRRGFRVLEQRVQANGLALLRVNPKRRQSLRAAREEIRTITGEASADFNHYYRLDSETLCKAGDCGPLQLIGLRDQADARCTLPNFAVIDTHVDKQHPVFANSKIEQLDIVAAGHKPLRDGHGTAVAALLAADSNQLTGAFPGADFLAINIFHVGPGGDRRADAYSLIAAIEETRKRGIRVANLSLSGPENEPLRQAVEDAETEGLHMIASVGNAGPGASALFPAGYGAVISVTAVDRELKAYRRAVRGEHVDFSAPGVDVASVGTRGKVMGHTGTSFASPYVTAAVISVLAKHADMQPAETSSLLAGLARDLGASGKDKIFGSGLVQVPPCGP